MSDSYGEAEWSPSKYRSDTVAPIYPPTAVLLVVASLLVVDAALFLPGGNASNWIGYVLGAFGTSVLVIVYRSIDLKRRRHPMYVRQPLANTLSTTLLIAGISLASIHVYFALQTSELA
jgi:hypothetical protein